MKPDALKAAADVLRYWELRQQVATNNLANAETPGFKAERVFARLLADDSLDYGAQTDMRTGSLRPTGGPLDVGLEEPDLFLVVGTQDGERLIRGGALSLDSNNRIVDAVGQPLLGDEGPITIPAGARVEIGPDGAVQADGKRIDSLRVERIGSPDQLVHEAAGRFRTTGATTRVQGPDRGVRAGTLEASNTNTLESMIELINIQRAYAAVQGGVRALDGVLDTVANRIGRVG